MRSAHQAQGGHRKLLMPRAAPSDHIPFRAYLNGLMEDKMFGILGFDPRSRPPPSRAQQIEIIMPEGGVLLCAPYT